MKFKIMSMLLLLLNIFLMNCSQEDDICTSNEATPRLKMKFKNLATGRLLTLDSLYISADYGQGKIMVLAAAKADSALVPLRLDEAENTLLYIKTKKNNAESVVNIQYTATAEYVSPACGFKKNYTNLRATTSQGEVQKAEISQTDLTNELKTQLFLHF